MNTPEFDLAVIGGGINGCGIAADAAGRGLSVVLLEAGDLGGGLHRIALSWRTAACVISNKARLG